MKLFNRKSIAKALLTIAMMMAQATVFAENNTVDTKWILVGDSPLLDRSSKYLSNDYTRAGIRYALKALARSQSEYTQIIAQQNLCIAYHRQAELALAAEHCTLARSLSMPEARLSMVKPGIYKIKRTNQSDANAIKLDTVIAHNLRIDNINTVSSRVASSE